MTPPLRRRHAACPCGSRRTLAACCLPWEEALHRLFSRLAAFAGTPRIRLLEARAASTFWNTEGSPPPGRGKAAAESLRFLEWFLQDYVPQRGGPLLGEFADSATGLSPGEETLLFALLLTPVRAYEVIEGVGTRGVLVKDLLAGGESLVSPLALSDLPIRSDVLVCRLLPLGRLARPGAGLLVLPAASREEMLAYLRTAYQLARPARHTSLEDFLDGSAHLYHHFFLLRGRALGGRARETLRRATFAPGQARYCGTDTARIRAVLDRQQELERAAGTGEEAAYLWIDPDGNFVRAAVCVRPGEVHLSAETREGLAEGRGFLEACLRGLIQPIEEQAEECAPGPEADGRGSGSRPCGLAFFRRVMDSWSDTPSMLLDGRTPRAACESQAGRRQVADLLAGLEMDFARQKRLGRAWSDVAPLRQRLNLLPVAPAR